MARDDARLIENAKKAAIGAGVLLMRYFKKRQRLTKQLKADHTLVTDADFAAQQYIEQELKTQSRGIPLLSEEQALPDFNIRQHWQRYWLIDPLDGTKRFLKGCDDFVVCIALIEAHYPVIGVIYHPASKTLYYARQGKPSYLLAGRKHQILRAVPKQGDELTVICSPERGLSSKAKAYLPAGAQYKPLGSALKFCYLARGMGDVYPGFGTTCEWDVAAGQCILEQAGGKVVDDNGERFSYNTRSKITTRRFWAVRDPALLEFFTNKHNQ